MHNISKFILIVFSFCIFGSTQSQTSPVKPIKSVPIAGKTIALTFDDGIAPIIHKQMLDILKKEAVPVTFFLIGKNTQHKQLIKQAIQDGHEIGNHSMTHPVLPSLSYDEIEQEIQGFQTVMLKEFNYQAKVFRAPKLRYDKRVMQVLSKLDLVAVNATVGTKDYADTTSREYILDTATQSPKLTEGSIILMHEVQKTADVLPDIIKFYKQAGYTFMTVSQMLNLKDKK